MASCRRGITIRNYDRDFHARIVIGGTQMMQNDKVTPANETKREKIHIHVRPQYGQDQGKK